MSKTTEYIIGVRVVTSLAIGRNQEIGVYQEHFINEAMGITVRLSNGRIYMSRETLRIMRPSHDTIK